MKVLPLGLILGLLLTTIGCDQPSTTPRIAVSGQVSLRGKPLDEGAIRFVSKQRNADSTGTVVAGQFRIDQESGPRAGQYDVIITPLAPELSEAMASIQAGDRDPLHTRRIPLRYQKTGTLKATVDPEQLNEFRFELTSR